MKVALRIVAAVVAVYFISWSAVYVWIVGSDFRYYGKYLHLAWTNPGELPAFLQVTSIVVTVLILVLFFGVLGYRRMRVR